MRSDRPRLYVLTGSHPCAAVEAALQLKSIEYDRVDLPPLTQLVVGPLLYRGITVPGLRLGKERIVGSRAIIHRIDAQIPEPPLLPGPSDPSLANVLEAERWGDEVLQSATRRVIDAAFLRKPAAMESYVAAAEFRLPPALMRAGMPLSANLLALRNQARGDAARTDVFALPDQLERVNGWIADGSLGSDRPNAADLQIGSSIRLLLSIADLRPLIEGSPAAELTRWFPPMVGTVPAGVLPSDWLN